MNKKEFIGQIEEIIEADSGELTGYEKLADLEDWDSLAVMGFIAMVDSNMNFTLDAAKINACVTVNDLIVLVADHLEE
jgi:acyl carrier protein